jgi:hypothetical protein
MLVDVTSVFSLPDKVDSAFVMAALTHGKVSVDVVKGGVDIPR